MNNDWFVGQEVILWRSFDGSFARRKIQTVMKTCITTDDGRRWEKTGYKWGERDSRGDRIQAVTQEIEDIITAQHERWVLDARRKALRELVDLGCEQWSAAKISHVHAAVMEAIEEPEREAGDA